MNLIEIIYIEYNMPSVLFKREFKDLGFFEKSFLSYFYKKNWFNNSIANIFDKNSIIEYRKKNNPKIFYFYFYQERVVFNLKDLNLIIKQYHFFNFNNKLLHTRFFKNVKIFKKDFIVFLIIQKIFFIKYYNMLNSVYFKKKNNYNLIKLNWLFYVFLLNAKNKLIVFNLSFYSDWYKYVFKNNLIRLYKNTDTNFQKIRSDFLKKKLFYIKKIFLFYNKNYKKIYNIYNYQYKNIFLFRVNYNNFVKIKIKEDFKIFFKKHYKIKFKDSSFVKFLNFNKLDKYSFFFIRKNRIFNKGRYSRNRQLYRTGVYWCLWVSIILVYGLYFMFYRFSFNFGYIWWGILLILYSTIFSKIVKYNFISLISLKNELFFFFKWVGFIFNDFYAYLINIFKKYFYRINLLNNLILKNDVNKNYLLKTFYLYQIKIFSKIIKNKSKVNFILYWENMRYVDNSLFRYKTIIHWLHQIYRIITL